MRKDKAVQFMRQAQFMATTMSKDQSSKIGFFALSPGDYTVLTQGFNGLPRGANDDLPARHTRPSDGGFKYEYFEHAERNGVYNLARQSLVGSTCITTEKPTMDCIRALISVGCTELFLPFTATREDVSEDPQSEDQKEIRAFELFKECGGKIFYTFMGSIMNSHGIESARIREIVAALYHLKGISTPKRHKTLFLKGTQVLAEGQQTFEDLDGMTEFSIRNAIYSSVRSKLHGSIGIVTATPCYDCARALAASGLSDVIYVRPEPEMFARWEASLNEALRLLHRYSIRTFELTEQDKNGQSPLPDRTEFLK